MDRPRIKLQIWVNPELAQRIEKVARRGDITDWAIQGLEKGVALREEELIESARRKNLLQNIELNEKVS